MKHKVGLWVDHRKANIVILARDGESIEVIRSNVQRHDRPAGGSRGSRSKTVYGPQDVLAEDKGQRRFAVHLGRYYDRIISRIRSADSIVIFGPGEAKVELTKRLEREELRGRLVGIETVDKMTDRQVAAMVRLRFHK